MLVATVAMAAALVLPSAPHARSVGLPRSLRAGRLLQQLPTESAAAAEAPRLPDDFLAPEEFARRSTAHRNIAQLRVDAPRALSAPPDGSMFSEDICLKGDLGQTLAQGRQACPALQGSEPQASRPHTACYPHVGASPWTGVPRGLRRRRAVQLVALPPGAPRPARVRPRARRDAARALEDVDRGARRLLRPGGGADAPHGRVRLRDRPDGPAVQPHAARLALRRQAAPLPQAQPQPYRSP